MSQKLSFFRYFHLMAIAVFLLFSVAFFGFSFYNIKHKFYNDVAALKESYFQTQKELLQKEVNRFIEEIDQSADPPMPIPNVSFIRAWMKPTT
ncbi:MAG: hypothetical protein EOM49_04580 [Epsilonproteobacteria bacterium]|nr:hypothetical protein [Campylobacterota bacterium]